MLKCPGMNEVQLLEVIEESFEAFMSAPTDAEKLPHVLKCLEAFTWLEIRMGKSPTLLKHLSDNFSELKPKSYDA